MYEYRRSFSTTASCLTSYYVQKHGEPLGTWFIPSWKLWCSSHISVASGALEKFVEAWFSCVFCIEKLRNHQRMTRAFPCRVSLFISSRDRRLHLPTLVQKVESVNFKKTTEYKMLILQYFSNQICPCKKNLKLRWSLFLPPSFSP